MCSMEEAPQNPSNDTMVCTVEETKSRHAGKSHRRPEEVVSGGLRGGAAAGPPGSALV